MTRRKNISRRKTVGLTAAVTILAAIVFGCVWFLQPLWLFHRRDFREGNFIAKRVEAFRNERGRLPDDLEEIGAKGLSDRVFYQKVDDENYEIWFSTYLGESETYESSTKKWD